MRTEVEPADDAPDGVPGQTLRFGEPIQSLGLHWYAEPLDPLDHRAHAVPAARYAPPLATGATADECLRSLDVDVLAVPPPC